MSTKITRWITLTSDGGEWIGSIAGDGDTDGIVEGNYYVDGGIGAVDGITYDGQATGLSYDDFMALEQMPGSVPPVTGIFPGG